MAVRTCFLFQETADALHALVILDFGQRIFHGMDGAVIREVEFACFIGTVLRPVEDMLFDSRPIIDDFLFFIREVLERDICPDAHCAADVCHKRPHQCFPGRNGAVVNGKIFIGYERRAVDHVHHARTSACAAGTLAVKGKLFG